MDTDTLTMPPVTSSIDDPEEERKRKLIASAGGPSLLPPITPVERQPVPPAAQPLPPVSAAPAPRSQPSPATPALPPITGKAEMAAPAPNPTALPPIMGSGDSGKAAMAAPPIQPNAQQPLPPVGPQQTAYNAQSAQPRPELTGWKNVLDRIGSIFPIGRAIEQAIPGSPQNYDAKLNQAAVRAAKEQAIGTGQREAQAGAANTKEARQAYLDKNPDLADEMSDFEKHDFILTGKMPQKEPVQPQPGKTPEEATLHDLMTGENGGARVNPDTGKPYSYLEAYGATNQAKQDTRNVPQKNAGEQIQEQIAGELAKPKPDQKVVKNLQDRLKAINPIGEERLRQAESKANEATNKKTTEEGAIESAAKSLANGELTNLKDIASMRGDQRLLIFAKARELNPKFNSAEIERKVKTMEQFTTGKQGDQLQSFGTFLEHAGALKDTMEALKPVMSSKILNHSMNWLRKNVSDDPAYPRVLAALDPVQKEFESYLLNNRALYTEDRENVEQIINGDLPIHQMEGAINQMGHTVQARYNEAGKRFKNTMGKNFDEMGLTLTDEALEGAKKIGVKIGEGSGTAKEGVQIHNGFEYTKEDDGKWHKGKPIH